MSSISAHKVGFGEKEDDERPKSHLLHESIRDQEMTTRNTSNTSSKNNPNRAKEPDGSFAYANIDLEDKKESALDERCVSERIVTRTTNVYASNFQRIMENKSYGCSCGNAMDPTLNG